MRLVSVGQKINDTINFSAKIFENVYIGSIMKIDHGVKLSRISIRYMLREYLKEEIYERHK